MPFPSEKCLKEGKGTVGGAIDGQEKVRRGTALVSARCGRENAG